MAHAFCLWALPGTRGSGPPLRRGGWPLLVWTGSLWHSLGMSCTLALYPGSFDPVTHGHLNLVSRGLKLFDRVVIAVASNARKSPLFSVQERVQMIEQSLGDNERVEVDVIEGLLVHYAEKKGASCIMRGLRAVSDFEYEFQLAHMNRRLAGGLETVFMMTGEEHFYVSSQMVREVASLGGNVQGLVPPNVDQALKEKFKS